MGFNISTYKLIKSLRPIDVFDIMTRDVCPDIRGEAIRESTSMNGCDYYINNWKRGSTKFESLSIFLSDTGFSAITTKERAEELEKTFKSWGLFYEVWSSWYGGSWYKVGFNYTYDAFDKLYLEWIRNKKLEEIGI